MNLLDATDRSNLYKKKLLLHPSNEVEIFSRLGVSREILNVNESGHIVLNEHGLKREVCVETVADTARKLTVLQQCEGFEKWRNGFSNEPQFSDTMFEVNCAYHALINFSVTELVLSPEVMISGKTKQPDFKFLTRGGQELYCECKSLASAHRIKNSRIKKFIDNASPDFRSSLEIYIPSGYRIEVVFKKLPSHWNRNFPDQLKSAIKTIVDKKHMCSPIPLNFNGRHEVHIKFSHIDDPVLESTINIASKEPGDKNNLIFGEILNLKKDVKRVIREALKQLPDNKLSVIYLYSLKKEDAKQGIEDFFHSNGKKNLCGVFSWTDTMVYHNNPRGNLNMMNLYNGGTKG